MEEEHYVFTQARDIGHLITFHIIFLRLQVKGEETHDPSEFEDYWHGGAARATYIDL
jgi:hypothetical protein